MTRRLDAEKQILFRVNNSSYVPVICGSLSHESVRAILEHFKNVVAQEQFEGILAFEVMPRVNVRWKRVGKYCGVASFVEVDNALTESIAGFFGDKMGHEEMVAALGEVTLRVGMDPNLPRVVPPVETRPLVTVYTADISKDTRATFLAEVGLAQALFCEEI